MNSLLSKLLQTFHSGGVNFWCGADVSGAIVLQLPSIFDKKTHWLIFDVRVGGSFYFPKQFFIYSSSSAILVILFAHLRTFTSVECVWFLHRIRVQMSVHYHDCISSKQIEKWNKTLCWTAFPPSSSRTAISWITPPTKPTISLSCVKFRPIRVCISHTIIRTEVCFVCFRCHAVVGRLQNSVVSVWPIWRFSMNYRLIFSVPS